MINIGLGIASAGACCAAAYLSVNGEPSGWTWFFAVFCVLLMEAKP